MEDCLRILHVKIHCTVQANSEAVSRRRRRNEVCNSLKQSSVIYSTYIIKNILELILQTVFIPFNFILNYDSEKNRESSHCLLEISAVDRIKLPAGEIHFECEGKKVEFFLILVYIQIGIQARGCDEKLVSAKFFLKTMHIRRLSSEKAKVVAAVWGAQCI